MEALADLVQKLTDEGLISMRGAAEVYGRGTHKSTPTRHALKGVKTANGLVKLEVIRVSGALCTSRAAVLRFFERQNAPTVGVTPTVAPAARKRRASKASTAVASLLGAA